MTFSGARAAAQVATIALLLGLGLAGCEGDISGGGPRVELDGGGTPGSDAGGGGGTDAGDPVMGTDAATPPPVDAARPPLGDECGTAIEREQIEITNDERESRGLSRLRCDRGLTASARGHAQDMCDLRYFSHTSADGRSMRDRIVAAGVTWRRIGENIARGQGTPSAVHTAWMNSDGHRANILNTGYGRIGVGHVACPGYGPVWVQNFAD